MFANEETINEVLKIELRIRPLSSSVNEGVVAPKVHSFHNSFIHIALWAVMCLKDDSILFGDDIALLGNRSRVRSSRNCRLLQMMAVYGPDTFVRNVGNLLPNDEAPYLRRL